MKKVLHVFPAYKQGGAPINTLRFIKKSNHFIDNYAVGFKSDLLMFRDYEDNTKKCFDVNLTYFSVCSLIKLIRIIFDVRPDIVHCNGKGGALYSFFLKIILFWYPFKIYYTFRGFNLKYSSLKSRLYCLFESFFSFIYTKSIAVSNSERTFILDNVFIKKSKVVIIPNGISVIKKDLPDRILEVVNNYSKNVVSLSRISHQKDIITMIEVFNKLNDDSVALHIMGGYLKGDLAYKDKVEKKLRESSLSKNIYLWGDVSNASSYLHRFDVYISTALFEGLPTAIIEAGLNEVIVIGTKCRGNVDLINDNNTGFLCEKKDFICLSDKLRYVLNNLESDEMITIKKNNLDQSLRYSVENNCENILSLYGVNYD